ncbi:MAG: orotate phosphoribosyltransferase [Planctomycetaceae bacterium]|nr:orotate phosphoribosyltransferase [Planctomycetaceae bacterium]
MYQPAALHALIEQRALKRGDFTLASGKKSSYFLNCKQVTLDSFGAKLIGEGILDLLRQDAPLPKAVGGMSIGADPITASVVTVAGYESVPLLGFLVRKETKDHGATAAKYIEGPVARGDDVVIVEDVVTTGGSSLLAIERCLDYGLKVRGVIAIVDRLEGGREAFAAKGYWCKSLFTIRDFGIEPPVG